MKRSLQLTCVLAFVSAGALASERAQAVSTEARYAGTAAVPFKNHMLQDAVSGTVRDSSGMTLPGVSVLIKGTTKGTQTDVNGHFTVPARQGDVLVFTYIGYVTKEVTVGSQRTVNITLNNNTRALNEVVVTALGIRRSEKSLTYTTQQVSGDELTKVRTDNMMNSLNGKIAGVTISPSAGGLGGSAKVILRGSRSFAGNNQPLYVIDGVPMSNGANTNGQPNSPYGGSTNVDGGDGISNLNPEDIESISVLKGASASALYGSQAANGVILITTKKGKAGAARINFSSSFTTDRAAVKPEFQDSYGRTTSTSTDSWGSKISGTPHDNLDEFFQTGTNATNSLSLSGGTETAQTYFSFSNTHASGIEPGNKLNRNNFNLRETAKFLDNKLTLDGNVNYVAQKINNTPGLGFYFNPLTGLYLFPRGMDITPYKNGYLNADTTGYGRQNWIASEDIQQNPWWITNRNLNLSRRNRVLLNGSARYDFTSWLNLQVRGNLDRTSDNYEQDLYAGTQATLSKANGNFIYNEQTLEQKYGDALLTFTVPGQKAVKADGVVGASINDSKIRGTAIGSGQGLSIPDLFIAQNVLTASGGASNASTLPEKHSQIQSLFGNLNLSYRDWVYLNLTARNDWASNLAFTPNGSYFYPSAGLSVLPGQVFKLPRAISYAKVRFSFAQVGNAVPQYVTNPVSYLEQTGSVVLTSVAPFRTLKPEKTNSYEAGADLRLFNDKLNFNFTWYKSNTVNQFIQITPSAATSYSVGYLNAGKIENKGFEFVLGYNVFDGNDFKWNTSFNGARNINTIIDVASDLGFDQVVLTGSYNTTYESILATGGSYGDIYGKTTAKDAQGRIIVGTDGKPLVNNDFRYIGNPNPKFTLGWNNSFSYKKFNLGFLVDGKFGGQVLSMTQAVMDYYGVSATTGEARDQGGVKVNGADGAGNAINSVDPKNWYQSIGGKQGVSEQYIYSATTVRLREASLGYDFALKNNVIRNLRLSLTGRNLLYFYKKAPYDPEITMSSGNGLSGVDIFNQPALRTIGLSLNVSL